MAVVHNLLARIMKSGLGVLAPVVGISALLSVMATAGSGPQMVVSPFDWQTLMAGAKGNVYPIFKEFEHDASLIHRQPTQASHPVEIAQVNHVSQDLFLDFTALSSKTFFKDHINILSPISS